MRFTLTKNWWALVFRGLLAIATGILAFIWPGVTLFAVVMVFAAYAFIDGVAGIVSAVRAAHVGDRWGALVFEGIVGIAAAGITLFWPAITLLGLVWLIAGWAIVHGVLEIAAAIRLRKIISHEWLLILAGLASVVFGFLIAIEPIRGAVVLAWWFGAYALVFGVIMVGLGLRLRNVDHTLEHGGPMPLPAH